MSLAPSGSGEPLVGPTNMKIDMAFEIAAVIGIVAGFAIIIYGIVFLPEIVPTHIDMSNVVDTYGDKWQLIDLAIILSIVSILMFGLMTLVNRRPHILNYLFKSGKENTEELYRICRRMVQCFTMLIIWLLAIISFFIVIVTSYDPEKSILLVIVLLPFIMVTDIVTLYFIAKLSIEVGKNKRTKNQSF